MNDINKVILVGKIVHKYIINQSRVILTIQTGMSDPHYKSSENTDYPKPEPYLYIVAEESENEYLLNRYEGDDVKIISFEYDPPIENKYK